MMMRFFRRDPQTELIGHLYGAIVAQARQPSFYRDYGVSDTVEGRFEMVVLHLVLLIRRLRGQPELKRVSQDVFDSFCRDMDANLREMGIGDLAVPKRMRRLGEAFYGRAQSYETALSEGVDTLSKALAKNVFGTPAEPPSPNARRLASYMVEAELRLAGSDVARGDLDFPAPDTIS